MKAILRFLTSIRVAIILLIILALASILGTLIPQGRTVEEYAARYGGLSTLFIRLQLTELYRSIWYLGLLGLFALNITVCTLDRIGPKLRRTFHPKIENDPKTLAGMKIKDKIRLNAGLREAQAAVEKSLRASRYRVRLKEDGDHRVHLLGRKRMDGLFGSDFVHVGLLVIIAGGIVTAFGGFRTNLNLNPGDIKDVPKAGFAVRLDKFETEKYPDGSVKAWKSTLTVLENGVPARTQIVEVNHPLIHRGFSFYQTAYGFNWEAPDLEIRVLKKSDPTFVKIFRTPLNRREALGDKEKTEILVSRFIPDFVLGENNAPETRSLEPNNPAALVEGWRGGEKVFDGWVFAAYPDFTQMHGGAASDLKVELRNFDAAQYSVLEAAKDPGVPLIWIGCLLVMAGLFLAFYRPTWEIKVTIENVSGKTELTAGGVATKSRDRFESEFTGLTARLRRPQ
jgi:cytochrome c biogenesis protein